jgi:protein SCO1/2
MLFMGQDTNAQGMNSGTSPYPASPPDSQRCGPTTGEPVRPSPHHAGTKNAFILSLIVFLAAVSIAILWNIETKPRTTFFGHSISPAEVAYDFHFTNQDGIGTRLSHWRGKAVLFSFGFTHCPNVCPTTLTHLTDVFRSLSSADRDHVQIAFISVDPTRDTPAQLKDYLSYFDPAFVGLTGTKDEIDRATGAFGASYAFVHKPGDPAEDYNVMHSSNVYLISPKGDWELIYDVQQLEQPEKVAADIKSILHG